MNLLYQPFLALEQKGLMFFCIFCFGVFLLRCWEKRREEKTRGLKNRSAVQEGCSAVLLFREQNKKTTQDNRTEQEQKKTEENRTRRQENEKRTKENRTRTQQKRTEQNEKRCCSAVQRTEQEEKTREEKRTEQQEKIREEVLFCCS